MQNGDDLAQALRLGAPQMGYLNGMGAQVVQQPAMTTPMQTQAVAPATEEAQSLASKVAFNGGGGGNSNPAASEKMFGKRARGSTLQEHMRYGGDGNLSSVGRVEMLNMIKKYFNGKA